jgi:hypothetical protein
MRSIIARLYLRYPRFFQLVLVLLLVGWCFLNHWLVETLLGKSYFTWYLKSGALIALGTAIFTQVWQGLDKHTGLISLNPLHYLGSALQLVGLPLIAIGTHLDSSKRTKPVIPIDLWLAIPFFLAAALGLLLWLILIVPIQYFVYLLCGAPARLILASGVQLRAGMDDTQLTVEEKMGSEPQKQSLNWDASLRDKPLGLTNAFVAFFLVIISFWIN